MERFTVNGKEVEFDPFDLDSLDRYLSGLAKVDDERRVKLEGETTVETLRRTCEAVLDFFDEQLGEGKAEELFGQRINVRTIYDGFRGFVEQVNACVGDYAKEACTNRVMPQTSNRAQRREEKRRRS